ncbi:hypothetical protein [Streptomyces sp. NPDC005374]|uniref:hypothetical protein n=1 Tax=Streptomyces sp. NPDC005374 TaxID=3364713 RepID=UPI0036B93AD2
MTTPTSTWRHRARVRAEELRVQLYALPDPSAKGCPVDVKRDELRKGAERFVCRALELVDERSGLRGWWYGRLYEETLCTLHAADVAITRLLPPRDALRRGNSVLAMARPLLARDDPRLVLVERMVEGLAGVPAARPRRREPDCEAPSAVAKLLKAAHEVEEERAVRSRNFRNRLIRVGVILLFVLGGTCGAALVSAGAVPVCGDIAYSQDTPAPAQVPRSNCRVSPGRAEVGDVGLVMLFGLVGAALPMTARLQRFGGSWNPYSLQLYQEVIKLPTGSLVAVAGLLLLRTDVLPGLGPPVDWPQVAADAVLLGISQLAFTRTIDKRVSKLLAAAPDEEETGQLEKVSVPKPSKG